MKQTARSLIILLSVMTLSVFTSQAAVLTVDNDFAQCPDAQYNSIQLAVAAAHPGDTIRICPGTYAEQVRIDKSLRIEGITVGNQNLIDVMPAAVIPNSTSLATGNPIAAIILVDAANNVTLQNITVDGSLAGITGCAPNLIGIYYRNASGRIDSVAVRNIKLGPGLEGCQSGLGIFAQSNSAGTSKVEVLNSSVHDYQKNGITGNGVNTDLTARGNAVTGFGSTPFIAQNGIQVADGAKGTVESNSVINHVYALCADPEICAAVSTNVLVIDASDIKVRKNSLGKSQVNVYLENNGGEVSENVIFDTDVFDGVYVLGNNNKIQTNTIFNSDEAGVFVDGNNNKVQGNTINEAPVGIIQTSASSGNNLNGNRFFNTGLNSTVLSAMSPTRPNTSGRSVTPIKP
jgi:parallel beta-helix repeat protein